MLKHISLALTALSLCAAGSLAADQSSWKTTPGLYAVFNTTLGTFVCKLFDKETPKTVDNFVGLAEGSRQFIDTKTGQPAKKRFYDGLIFHRVIPNFMIQGGDPLGKGFGGPGYQFEDEIVPAMKFDHTGMLAMANAGPNTNGSQFFVTEAATPWLNGHHTIFGQVIEGLDVVTKIARVPRNAQDKPLTDVVINKISIERIKQEQGRKAANLSGKKVLIVVAPENFRDEEYFETKQILTDAGAQVVTASLALGEIKGVKGGKTTSEVLLKDVKAADFNAVAFIGGSGAGIYFKDVTAHQLARDAAAQNKVVAAICIAPATLANAGLLKGKKVTSDPEVKNILASQGAVISDAPVVLDGNIITGRGPDASKLFGETIVQALSK